MGGCERVGGERQRREEEECCGWCSGGEKREEGRREERMVGLGGEGRMDGLIGVENVVVGTDGLNV